MTTSRSLPRRGPSIALLGLTTFVGLSCAERTPAEPIPATSPAARLQAFADSLTFAQRTLWATGDRSIILTLSFDTTTPPTYVYLARPRR